MTSEPSIPSPGPEGWPPSIRRLVALLFAQIALGLFGLELKQVWWRWSNLGDLMRLPGEDSRLSTGSPSSIIGGVFAALALVLALWLLGGAMRLVSRTFDSPSPLVALWAWRSLGWLLFLLGGLHLALAGLAGDWLSGLDAIGRWAIAGLIFWRARAASVGAGEDPFENRGALEP